VGTVRGVRRGATGKEKKGGTKTVTSKNGKKGTEVGPGSKILTLYRDGGDLSSHLKKGTKGKNRKKLTEIRGINPSLREEKQERLWGGSFWR